MDDNLSPHFEDLDSFADRVVLRASSLCVLFGSFLGTVRPA
jgi:hypothetical protein